MKPQTIAVSRLAAVLAVAAGVTLTGCSSGSDTDTAAADPCAKTLSAGTVAKPGQDVTYQKSSAAFRVTFADGSTNCVVTSGPTVATWRPTSGGDAKLDLRTGDLARGLYFSVTDRGSSSSDDIPSTPTVVPGAFLALATDGNYYNDGWNTQCSTTLAAFDADRVAGTFTCKDLAALGTSGAFDALPTSTPASSAPKVTAATGWFEFTR